MVFATVMIVTITCVHHFQCIEKLIFFGQFSRLFIPNTNLPDVFVTLHACFIIVIITIFYSYYLIDEKNTYFMGTKYILQ